ncbi:MAG: hypothetical protein ACRCS3_07930 [Paracoccaceae bacterium]
MNALEEAAARYGVSVAPDATFAVIPRGVSGIPILPEGKGVCWKDGASEKKRIMDRNRKFERAAAVAEVKQKPVRAPKQERIPLSEDEKHNIRMASPLIVEAQRRHAERVEIIKRMAAEGAHWQAIGEAVGIVNEQNLRAMIRKVCPDYVIARRNRRVPVEKAEKTAERDAKIMNLLAGRTQRQVAEIMGLSEDTVSKIVKRIRSNGMIVSNSKRLAGTVIARDTAVTRMHAEGKTLEEMSLALNLTQRAIRTTMARCGIEAPPIKPHSRNRNDINAAVQEMAAEGHSAHAIAIKLGVTRKTVLRRMAA